MIIEGDILTLAQWLSPAFPVGGFAYSHGLETAIEAGTIVTADNLSGWLRDVLEHGSGRNDCVLLRAAYACADAAALANVNATALAFAASSERVLETRAQGDAFCQTVRAVWRAELSGLVYPVAVGASAAQMGIDVGLTAAMYLQCFISNLVSVAVRAVPLGQTEGQAVLSELSALCAQVAARTEQSTLDDLHSSTFLSDISAMTHETLQPRIFRT
jgi:urease accessory protein